MLNENESLVVTLKMMQAQNKMLTTQLKTAETARSLAEKYNIFLHLLISLVEFKN